MITCRIHRFVRLSLFKDNNKRKQREENFRQSSLAGSQGVDENNLAVTLL